MACFSSLRHAAVAGFLFAASLFAALECQAKLNVVATMPDLAAIASELGGDRVEVVSLVRPTEDPHFVDPKPSFIVKLNRADLLVEGGAELEAGWLAPLLQGARNPRIALGAPGRIAANEGVPMLEVPHTLDRSRGDIHAAGNPHYMVDPRNAVIVAQRIAKGLASVDPKSAPVYQENLAKFTATLERSIAGWEKKLAPFRGRELVGFHNSWPYFSQRFGLKMELFLEPKPGVPPTPAHLAQVIIKAKERNARVILIDTYNDRRTAEAVAARTGATLVEVSHFPGGMKDTEGSYIRFMDRLVGAVAEALARG